MPWVSWHGCVQKLSNNKIVQARCKVIEIEFYRNPTDEHLTIANSQTITWFTKIEIKVWSFI